jgi:hypothetical protein
MMLPGGLAVNSLQFEMDSLNCGLRVFAVKSFHKYKYSNVAVQREFRKKFWVHRKSKFPSAYAIKTRSNNFEGTGSTVMNKGGSDKIVRTAQNIACCV